MNDLRKGVVLPRSHISIERFSRTSSNRGPIADWFDNGAIRIRCPKSILYVRSSAAAERKMMGFPDHAIWGTTNGFGIIADGWIRGDKKKRSHVDFTDPWLRQLKFSVLRDALTAHDHRTGVRVTPQTRLNMLTPCDIKKGLPNILHALALANGPTNGRRARTFRGHAVAPTHRHNIGSAHVFAERHG